MTNYKPQRFAGNEVKSHDLIQRIHEWIERLINAVKNGCNAMHSARRLIGSSPGFLVAIFVALWLQAVRVSGTELYKKQQHEAVDPRELFKILPLLTFFTSASADWLTAPTSVISQITHNFTHLSLSSGPDHQQFSHICGIEKIVTIQTHRDRVCAWRFPCHK